MPELSVYLLAIDPGKRSGWALFRLGQGLIGAGPFDPDSIVEPPCGFGVGPGDLVVIERPRDRPGKGVPANDLITLALRAGRVAGVCACFGMTVTYFFPEQWKGSLDKAKGHARIQKALLPGEPWPDSSDARDAIGLGMWVMGRNPCGVRGG